MTNFKGTRGKWKVWKSHGDYGHPIIGTENGTTLFITSLSSDNSPYHYESNAILISKAPEMLEMLEKLHPIFKELNVNPLANEIEQLIKSCTEL